MTDITVNVLEIFQKYTLQAEEMEPVVYKILNTNDEISITELQWELVSCIVITSNRTKYKKLPNGGIHSIVAKVYYVITDFDRSDLGHKYNKLATLQYGMSVYRNYKYRPELANSIDTIYAEGEI